jgi:hypothetical protein
VDVLFSAGLPGLCAKRSGRGVFVDLMVRMEVYAMHGDDGAFCWMSGRRERVNDGRRKAGGSRPQLRGVLGGIGDVVVPVLVCDVSSVSWRFSGWSSGLQGLTPREVAFIARRTSAKLDVSQQ